MGNNGSIITVITGNKDVITGVLIRNNNVNKDHRAIITVITGNKNVIIT